MKKLIYLISILSFVATSLFAQDSEPKKLTDKQMFEMLGQLIASQGGMSFDKMDMKDDEVEAFMKGFKKGLKEKLDMATFQKNQTSVMEIVKKRVEAFNEKNPVVFPLDTKIKTVDGKETTIKELMKDQNGVLLDFYASWCGPCMALMPSLKEKASKLKDKKILVAGMNTKSLEDAVKVKDEHKIDFTWLVEPEGRPFSKLLNVDSIPRMILVAPDGKVLFNGHPQDGKLEEKLASLAPKAK